MYAIRSYYDPSWDALLDSTSLPNEEFAKEDLDAFYDKLSRKYFKTVNDELKKVAPHQNYMGCRLARNNFV